MQQLIRQRLANIIRKWLWAIWLCTIFFLSFIPGENIPEIKLEIVSVDTLVHIIMYGILAFLTIWAFELKVNHSVFMLYIAVILSCLFIGLGVEFIQGNYVSKRFFSWGDAVANGVGTIVGSGIYKCTSKKLFNYGESNT